MRNISDLPVAGVSGSRHGNGQSLGWRGDCIVHDGCRLLAREFHGLAAKERDAFRTAVAPHAGSSPDHGADASHAQFLDAALKKLLLLTFLCLLAACAQLDAAGDAVERACHRALPLAKIASLIPGVPASIAAYVILGCETVEGIAKLRADPTSAAWLESVRAELEQALRTP